MARPGVRGLRRYGPEEGVLGAGVLPTGQGRLALVESPYFVEAWLTTEVPLDPSYYRVMHVVAIGTAVKGGPGPDAVRSTEGVKTLTRWEHNARLRRVASAVYPTAETPTDAVRRWYTHGGSMQPLRWSDEQVREFVSAVRTEQSRKGSPGKALLFVGPSHRDKEQRRRERQRERGPAGSAKREAYNARRREQRLRQRRRGRNQ